jgi:hypothetical protein
MAIEYIALALALVCTSLLLLLYLQSKTITSLKDGAEALSREIIEAKRAPQMTLEATDLLHELTTKGKALVIITPVNPSDFYLRRPN